MLHRAVLGSIPDGVFDQIHAIAPSAAVHKKASGHTEVSCIVEHRAPPPCGAVHAHTDQRHSRSRAYVERRVEVRRRATHPARCNCATTAQREVGCRCHAQQGAPVLPVELEASLRSAVWPRRTKSRRQSRECRVGFDRQYDMAAPDPENGGREGVPRRKHNLRAQCVVQNALQGRRIIHAATRGVAEHVARTARGASHEQGRRKCHFSSELPCTRVPSK
eukprot:2220939-Prymnesium_polylepis.2